MTTESKEILKSSDFDGLSYGSLVRYKCYFNIEMNKDIIDNKNEIAKSVSKHFAKLEVNPKEVIEQFMQIDKDLSIMNGVNARKSVRNQEKAEKINISKVLDSFKTKY